MSKPLKIAAKDTLKQRPFLARAMPVNGGMVARSGPVNGRRDLQLNSV